VNFLETSELLARIQVGDNRKVDDLVIEEWWHLVRDLRLDDAIEAVREHRRVSGEYLTAQHVRAGVRRLRSQRLERTPLPEPPGGMTPVEYLAWLRTTRQAIADGRPPALVPALVGPPRDLPAIRPPRKP